MNQLLRSIPVVDSKVFFSVHNSAFWQIAELTLAVAFVRLGLGIVGS